MVTLGNEEIVVNTPREIRHSITIVGLPKVYQEEEIMNMLVKQNGYIKKFAVSNNIKDHIKVHVVKPLKNNPSCFQIFCDVSAVLHEGFHHYNEKVTLGLMPCKIYDRYNIKRCFNCQKFGHYIKDCPTKDEPICGKCSENHPTKDCESESRKCINCVRKNGDNIQHSASSIQCPSLMKEHTRLKMMNQSRLNSPRRITSTINGEPLKCSLWNITSMVHKTDSIMEHVLDRNSDIVLLTETWLTSDANHVTAMVKTYGYKLFHCRRKNRQKETGGGVGVLVKLSINSKQLKSKVYESFEHTIVKISLSNKKSVTFLCIYWVLFVSLVIFLKELTCLLESLISHHDCLVIAGDVNIHMKTDGTYSKRFNGILDMFDMIQHVKVPTHKIGHTLDIVATFNNNPITELAVN